MATRAAILGTGGTNAAAVSTTNSGRAAGVTFDAISVGTGASLTWDTTRSGFHGDRAMKVTTTGTAANSFGRWDAIYRPASGAAQVATAWVYFTGLPAATISVLSVRNATAQTICELRITSAGKARAVNAAGTNVAETTTTIAFNQWVRIDMLFTPHASAGTLQVKLYNTASSSTPTETTALATGQNLRQAQVEQAYVGNTTGTLNTTYWVQAAFTDGPALPFTGGWVMSRWLGAVTDTSAGVSARVLGASSVRLKVSTTSDLLTSPAFSSSQSPDADGTARMAVTGLTADTQYYYGIEVDGVVDTAFNGSFRTAPTPGSQKTFTFCAASCAQNNSNAATFDAIRGESPVFFAHLGDLHYRDITTNDQVAFHKAMDQVMSAPRYAQLLGEVPSPYVWSDHDSVGPNGDSTSAALPAANAVYRSRVPSHTLPATTGTYFAFTWGRVRMVFTDGRSFMDPITDTDDSNKTKLGATQKAWLISELTSDTYPVKIWFHEDAISNGTTFPGDDTWSAYSTERAEIFAAIAGENVAYICGDLHMVAADDGTNVPTLGAASGIPVHVASPMDNTSFGGNGTYTAGEYPTTDGTTSNQYGRFVLTDTGSEIELLFQGKDAGGTVRVTQTTSWTIATPATGTLQGVLPALTASFAGEARAAGALAGTLPAPTATATGSAKATGSLSGTLPALAASASATAASAANLAGTLPALTASSEGAASTEGGLAASLPALTAALTGTSEKAAATLAATLPALTGTLAGSASTTAELTATLPALTGAGTGEAEAAGSLAGTLPALTAAFDGTSELPDTPVGELGATLPALQGALEGEASTTADLAAVLPALLGGAVGESTAAGDLAGALPALTLQAEGEAEAAGAFPGSLPAITAALAGTATAQAAMSASLPLLTVALAGHVIEAAAGTLHGALPALTAAMAGTSDGSDLPEPASLSVGPPYLKWRVGAPQLAHATGAPGLGGN